METQLAQSIKRHQKEHAEKMAKKKEIKKFANQCGYSDVNPFEVIRTISPICVEVRAMKTKQIRFPKDFHPGGFVGHYADNRGGQEYEYSSDESFDIIRIRWSKAKKQWQSKWGGRFSMADKPYKFYDYNF